MKSYNGFHVLTFTEMMMMMMMAVAVASCERQSGERRGAAGRA
jgi:hypothetical protein